MTKNAKSQADEPTKSAARGYVLPPDRPTWETRDREESDLLYLGWGRRYHGRNSPPPYKHPGWQYIFLLSGSPIYLVNETSFKATPKSLIIIHPECAFGATDTPSGCCSWLLWLWQSPPPPSVIVPVGGYTMLSPSTDEISVLKQLHTSCRLEVSAPDAFTSEILQSYRRNLDILIARHSSRPDSKSKDAYFVEMAVNWLRLNPTSRQPIPSLCEYLQISAASVSRLFHRHLKESPARYHQRLRMHWAREQIQIHQKSAKEVAYSLGFHHPGDFSRAYKRMFKHSPSDDRNNH